MGDLLAKKHPKKPGEKWVGMGGFGGCLLPPHQKKGWGNVDVDTKSRPIGKVFFV